MSLRADSAMFGQAILLIAMVVAAAACEEQTAGASLVLESKIPLGEVSGRIDHLAIDVKRQRLFVAELGAPPTPRRRRADACAACPCGRLRASPAAFAFRPAAPRCIPCNSA